ncbi:hypothetical protein BGZ83_008834 [Gryganskiella cystojenkinii]|nr:hypothetical protein BGZ83_008834 [Gryganskiella cystojenkinii]
MPGPEEARLKDAIEFMREAEKNTEKSWFKKPDWDIAAQYYDKAGQSFKAGKSYEQAVQAFVKASEALILATSPFMAGRALENGGNIALQFLGQPERAADMYKRASELFIQNMTPDRAAEMLEKAAKAMEPISIESAIDLYVGACNIYEGEDRARYATDTFKRTISLLVKHKRYEKAVEVLQRLGNVQKDTPNKSAYFKTLLSIIIVQLATGDEVDAGKRFQAFCSVDGFVQSEESAIAHAMLDAYEHRDQAYYNQTAARQQVGFLDNEIARLARNITITDDLIGGGGGYVDPSQQNLTPGGPPGGFQQQQPYYGQGGPTPPRQPSPYQPQHQQQPPSVHHQPQPGFQQPAKDVYQGRPSTSGGYEISPPSTSSGVPPPYSNDRQEADWRALTEKPAPRPQQPPYPQQHQQQPQAYQQAPYQQQQPPQHPPHPQSRVNQPAGASPSRNYYDDVGDDDLL